MSTPGLIFLLNSIQTSSFQLYEQVKTMTTLIEKEDFIDPEHLLTITLIKNSLQGIKKLLNKFSSPLSLKRSKSCESEEKTSSISTLEAVKFFSVGRHLLDPLNQEKFQENQSEAKSLQEFLTLYNSFSLSPNENIFSKLKDLELSLKLYIKKSNKTTVSRKSSYGLNSLFCDKFISWLSKSSKSLFSESISKPSEPSPQKSLFPSEVQNQSFCKIFPSIDEAVADIEDGHSLIIGGFGVVGTPEGVLRGLLRKGVKNLNISTCLAGTRDSALGELVLSRRVKRLHISHIGSNTAVEEQFLNGELEVEFTTQGTLVEKFRAASMGIHSFYTPSGSGTFVEKGAVPTKFTLGGKTAEKFTVPKPFIQENGQKFFLEKAETGDFAILKAWKADRAGNLVFRRTARNSNPDIAGSCPVTIAEVEELVEEGEIDPDQVHVAGVFVQRVVLTDSNEKYVERLSFRKDGGIHIPGTPEQIRKREIIAKRAAKEIRNGMYVNLGIGIPTLIPNFLPDSVKIVLHGENGVLGIGPYPAEGLHDPDTVNAGRETITINPGGSTFRSSDSFGIIRGNHLDITFLGGLQVSQFGDLANWIVPQMKVKGMGGAVDLVCSRAKCIVCMEHLVFGNMKILKKCKLPLTGKMVVDKLITDLAVFEFNKDGMMLVEIAQGVSIDTLRAKTQAEFLVAENLKIMQ